MLYHRDERTGEHLLTHNGQEQRFPTRAEAISAARHLLDEATPPGGPQPAR